MSGIAGCYNFDGAPPDRLLLERMKARLAHRGPDGSGLWVGDSAGLVHLAFHTTPESVHERQPLADVSGSLHLTLDGRVDNRDELLADLRAKGFEPRDDTDAELVLQAYGCWGEECPARIIGDFAFAIWDRSEGKLFCARDVVGMRQFYYFRDSRIFLWASEWRALFEHAAVSRAPNENYIAQYLCYTFTGNADTLFRDVVRLPAGHSLTVTRGGLRLRRYWDVDTQRAVRYRSDDEYGEHFREIFRESVRCRLRSSGPVATSLSGGLDSSAVVGMVETLRAEGAAPCPGQEVYSLLFPGRPCDERPYIEAVAQRWNLTPHYREAAMMDRSHYEAQVRADFDLPHTPNLVMHDPLCRLMRARGIRVELSGIGGDEWFTGSYYGLADLLRQRRFAGFIQLVRKAMSVKEHPMTLAEVLRFGFWPLLPPGFRLALRRLLGRVGDRPLIGPALAGRLPSPAVLTREPVLGACTSFDQSEMYALLHGGDGARTMEQNDRRNARHGIEARWPLLDRRVIEFAFALPEDQRRRGVTTKYIVRHAMRDLLPNLVAARSGKSEFSHLFVESLRAMRGFSHAGKPSLEQRGWVRDGEVKRICDEALSRYNRSKDRYNASVWLMWSLFAVETWMNEVAQPQSRSVHGAEETQAIELEAA